MGAQICYQNFWIQFPSSAECAVSYMCCPENELCATRPSVRDHQQSEGARCRVLLSSGWPTEAS